MRSVKIKTKELLAVLKANRTQHEIDFKESWEGYVAEATKQLEDMAMRAKEFGEIKRGISLVEPKSYADSYETAIRMLEMSDDKVVELTAQEFSQYVEDKWMWKEAFAMTSAMYKG